MKPLFPISVLVVSGLAWARADNSTASDTCELQPWEAGPWGGLLEEWATSDTGNNRQGRIMALPPSPSYYVTDRMDLSPPPAPPSMPPHPRPYYEWQPPHNHPGKIVNRPPQKDKDKFKPSYPPPQPHNPQSKPSPQRPVDRVDEPPQKQVSETDLFLLGAIEKLVYRVDLMEKRLRKMEESMHLLVAGAEPKPEPCVSNFTRIGGTCYHFSVEPYDWKTANLACRKLRSNLLEAASDGQRRKLHAAMQADKRVGGYDFWTGGLNPGLLWIWSNSARPINNSTANATNGHTDKQITIVGEGRCLAMVFDAAVRSYVFRGQDCALRHRFICEKEDDKAKLSNEIERVAKALRDGKGRKPKIIWND